MKTNNLTQKALSIGRTLTSATTTPAETVQKAGVPSSGRIGSGGLSGLPPRGSTPSAMRQFASKPDGNSSQSKTTFENMADLKASLKSALSSADQLKRDLGMKDPDQLARTMSERHKEIKKALKEKGIDSKPIQDYVKAQLDSMNERLKPFGIKFDITFSDSLGRVTNTITPGSLDDDSNSGGRSAKMEFERAFLTAKGPSFNIVDHEITPILTARLIGIQGRVEGSLDTSASGSVLPRIEAGIVQIEAGVDFKSNSRDKGLDGRAVIGGKYAVSRAATGRPGTVVGHFRSVSPRTEKGNDFFLEGPTLKQSPRETSKAFLKRVERVAIEIAEVSKNLQTKRSENSIPQQSQDLEDWEFVRTVFASHIREAELAEFNKTNRSKDKNSIDSTQPITDLEIKEHFKPEP